MPRSWRLWRLQDAFGHSRAANTRRYTIYIYEVAFSIASFFSPSSRTHSRTILACTICVNIARVCATPYLCEHFARMQTRFMECSLNKNNYRAVAGNVSSLKRFSRPRALFGRKQLSFAVQASTRIALRSDNSVCLPSLFLQIP